MKLRYSIALAVPLASANAMAADLALKLDIPQLNVAEYHRPYIAAWLVIGRLTASTRRRAGSV